MATCQHALWICDYPNIKGRSHHYSLVYLQAGNYEYSDSKQLLLSVQLEPELTNIALEIFVIKGPIVSIVFR